MSTPLTAARTAAKAAFDAHLIATRCTATAKVPQDVIDAATAAYREAGGEKDLAVVGHGNCTHPVCGVDVKAK